MSGPRFVDASDRARVILRGKDARAFLHRMSTQHITEMNAGDVRRDVLTNDKGRIVDLVHVRALDDGLLLVGSRGRGEIIRAWLDRYLFTEDVTLEDVSGQGGCLEVVSEDAPSAEGALVLPMAPRRTRAWLVVTLADGVPMIAGERVDAATWESERIAFGVVGEPELTDKHNPLDLELHDAIHWNKGCYIGQEVIARLDTYAKQQRRLGALVVDPAGLAAGAQVLVNGAVVGEVTSVSPVNNGDRASALAVVKHGKDGADVVIRTGELERAARLLPSSA